MNKKSIELDSQVESFIKINNSSRIIDAQYDEYTVELHLNYFESPFSDALDVYHFVPVYTERLYEMSDCIGYTLYGRFWSEFHKDWFYLFGKQVDREKVNVK